MKKQSLVIPLAILAVGVFAVCTVAAQERANNPLVGNWICEEDGTQVQIRANGSLTINNEEYAYKVKGSVINVIGEEGTTAIPFHLDGDTLSVDVEGREMVYVRTKAGGGVNRDGGAASGGVMQALVGKWCYLSSLTGSNSRMSNRCFVLSANGTYEYSSETSTSGAYGSTHSQDYDAGRWSATRTTLTSNSNTRGQTVYPIELRNHPKTGDPMIVVDGDAYVTAFQKSPW